MTFLSANRIALVTRSRERSVSEPGLRSRPPSPTARPSSRERNSISSSIFEILPKSLNDFASSSSSRSSCRRFR